MKIILNYTDKATLFKKPDNAEEFKSMIESLYTDIEELYAVKRLPLEAKHIVTDISIVLGSLFATLENFTEGE